MTIFEIENLIKSEKILNRKIFFKNFYIIERG